MKASQKLQKQHEQLKKKVISEIVMASNGKGEFDLSHIGTSDINADAEFSCIENNIVSLENSITEDIEEHELEDFTINDLLFILESIEIDNAR